MATKSRTHQFGLMKLQTSFPSVKIGKSQEMADFIRQFYSYDIGIFESCFILTLNNNMTTTGFMKISQGGITETVVDVRLICKYAIENLASVVVLAHNHPSGVLCASDADKSITAKVKQALKTLDISLIDHIILTEDSYFSMSDERIF